MVPINVPIGRINKIILLNFIYNTIVYNTIFTILFLIQYINYNMGK